MERIGRMFKILLILIFMAGALLYGIQVASALDEIEVQQLKTEIDNVAKEDPALAKAVEAELREAVKMGEIDLPEAERPEQGRHREKGPDPDKVEQEFEGLLKDLIKSGMTPEEAEKKAGEAIREKYGEQPPSDFERPMLDTPEGRKEALDRLSQDKEHLLKEGFSEQEIKEIEDKIGKGEDPREIFERHFGDDFDRSVIFDREGPEGMSKEEMEKEFVERMGREPTEQEREMMEREMDREMMEREMMEREMGDREMMEREMGDREMMEREMGDREMMDREMMEREMGERERYEREFDREERYKEGELPPPPPPE